MNLENNCIILKAAFRFDRKMLTFGLLMCGFCSFIFFYSYFIGDLFNYGRSAGETSDLIFGIVSTIFLMAVGLIARLEFLIKDKFIIVTDNNIVLQNIRPFSKLERIEYSDILEINYLSENYIRIKYGNKKIQNFLIQNFVRAEQFQVFFDLIKKKFPPR